MTMSSAIRYSGASASGPLPSGALDGAAEGVVPDPHLWLDIGHWMFEGSPDCVKLIDRQGRVLLMNGPGQSLMEIDDFGAFAGIQWESCWPVHCRPVVRAALESAFNGETSDFQAPCPTSKGTPKWWDVRAMPLRQGGRISHVLCVSRDITKLMDAHVATQFAKNLAETAARSAEDAVKAKTEFVANVSHELRTPLNAIGGLAHLLLDLEPTEQQRTYLRQMQVASQHAAMLMEEMLDHTELECGNLRLHEREFDLGVLLDETLPVVRQIAWSKGLDMDVYIDSALAPAVVGDATRLRNIVLSCASRAVGVPGASKLAMRVEMVKRGVDDMVLRFDLARAGSSLSCDEIATLVGEASPPVAGSSGSRGLGLGLAISRANAQLMQGELGVDCDPADGVSFWFTARLRLQPPAREAAPPRQQALSALEGKQVLVVEDDPLARDVAQHLLERAGVVVHLACDGEQAVAAVRGRYFDAVLMDIQMPVMDGMQATRIIRQQLGQKALPVIAVTGNVLEKDRTDCLDAGFTDFLAKPVDAPKLWSSLARCIAQAEVQADVQADVQAMGGA